MEPTGIQKKKKRKKRRKNRIYRLLPVPVLIIGAILFGLGLWKLAALASADREAVPAAGAGGISSVGHTPVIVIDPGHGGVQPGTVWESICEKDINLSIAKKLAEELKNHNLTVILTREGDEDISLEERVAMAERNKANLFVSIHQNALEDDTVTHGIETYCSDTAHPDSPALAGLIHKFVIQETQAADKGLKTDTDFYVTRTSHSFPSCLIETGFMTSEAERNLLIDEDYQWKIAKGIARGIEAYLQRIPLEETDTAGTSQTEASQTETTGTPSPSFIPQDGKIVYLTIDDGPSANTETLLDILDAYHAKATFFVTAQYLKDENLKDMLRAIDQKGHTIGVHTYSHSYHDIYRSVDAYLDDYGKMQAIISDAIGKESRIFRFPGGSNTSYNASIRKELLRSVTEKGLAYYDWNAFTGDTEGLSVSEMIEKAVTESSYNDKTILLMHDTPDKEAVLEALPQILSRLAEKGYRFCSLDANVEPIQFEKAGG